MIFQLVLIENLEQANGNRKKMKTVNDSTKQSKDFGKFFNNSRGSFAELDEKLTIFAMKISEWDLKRRAKNNSTAVFK